MSDTFRSEGISCKELLNFALLPLLLRYYGLIVRTHVTTYQEVHKKIEILKNNLDSRTYQRLFRNCLSPSLCVRALKSGCVTRLVPMSALLFSVPILTNIQVFVFDFNLDPTVDQFNVFEVSSHVLNV